MAILERFADKLPPEVLSDPAYVPPKTDATGRNRHNLRRAAELLDEAGWTVENGVRMKDGKPLEVEFLIGSQGFERIAAPFAKNLEKIGVRATLREVDPAQYRKRMEDFDFDITTDRKAMSLTPGIELRDYFESASASSPGSENIAGVTDPVVDGLIEIIERADSRETLTDAVKALDRVLRAKHIWIPQWHKGSHTIAYWDVFERPGDPAAIRPRRARDLVDGFRPLRGDAGGGQALRMPTGQRAGVRACTRPRTQRHGACGARALPPRGPCHAHVVSAFGRQGMKNW